MVEFILLPLYGHMVQKKKKINRVSRVCRMYATYMEGYILYRALKIDPVQQQKKN